MIANESGQCVLCNGLIEVGQEISWNRRGDSGRYHVACKSSANPAQIARQTPANDSLAAVLAASVQPFLTIQRDEITAEMEEFVSARISEALENLPKELKTIYIQSGKTIGSIEGHKHEHFDLVAQLVAIRKNVYLWGEAGSGKSTAAKQIAQLLSLPYYYLALQAQTTESRLMGYCDANGKYVPSDFYRAYSTGGVFLLDELEYGNDNLIGSLNGALANGTASFPRGFDGSGGITERHPDFVCIATGNTPGYGATVAYSASKALNNAVRDRFHFVQWDTDETLERQLAAQKFEHSDIWVTWIRNVREFCKVAHPKVTATQRASIEGSELLAIGLKPEIVAEMVVFRGYDRVSIRTILASHPLPTFAN